MFVIDHNTREVDSVAFAPVGSLLAVGHDHRWVGVWDIATQQLIDGVVRDRFYTRSEFRFFPAQARFHYLEQFGELEWRDPITKEHGTLCIHTGWTENATLTPDSKHLLVCERGSCKFRLFTLTSDESSKRWEVPVYSRGTWGIRVSVALHPDGERFVVAENHRNSRTRLATRLLETGELLAQSRLPSTSVSGIAISPHGQSVIVISSTSLLVFNADRGACAVAGVAASSSGF